MRSSCDQLYLICITGTVKLPHFNHHSRTILGSFSWHAVRVHRQGTRQWTVEGSNSANTRDSALWRDQLLCAANDWNCFNVSIVLVVHDENTLVPMSVLCYKKRCWKNPKIEKTHVDVLWWQVYYFWCCKSFDWSWGE